MKNKMKYLIILIIVIISVVIGWFLSSLVGNSELKVTFDSNGGSLVTERIVEKDSIVVKPKNPTKEGYDFVEWQLDGKTYDFSSKITKSINLVAVWEEKEEKNYS